MEVDDTVMLLEEMASPVESQLQYQQLHYASAVGVLSNLQPDSNALNVMSYPSSVALPMNPQFQQHQQHHHYQQQQQQLLLQSLYQQMAPQLTRMEQFSQVPLIALQQTLLVSPTGAVVGVYPFAATMLQQLQQNPQDHPNATVWPTQPIIHNLIPEHLQASALAPSLHGTPGYQPALIPQHLAAAVASNMVQFRRHNTHGGDAAIIDTSAILQALLQNITLPTPLSVPAPLPITTGLTVQDHPMMSAVYNGVNVSYPGLQQIHVNPPVFVVENFLTPFECNFLIQAADDSWTPAPVVGKGAGEISPSRTSSTCYLAREDLPDYMRKVSLLTSKPIDHCELPQVGRYLPSQQYLHHFDAFDLSNEDGRRFASNGGQRVVTVLVYLNDCAQGGQTEFPALNLRVSPRRGAALVFFPATVDGYLDKMVLHAALPAVETKYVSQVWIRQGNYSGQASKRLQNTLGLPFDAVGQANSLLGIQPSV